MPKLDRDGVKIHYEVHGKGPVILLTHGYSATSQMWQGQIEALTKHNTLVIWDMRCGRRLSRSAQVASSRDL